MFQKIEASDIVIPEQSNLKNCSVTTLKKRSDFLLAARSYRQGTKSFYLQARPRQDSIENISDTEIRIGFTCSKKIGNAVKRNRAKRRLRAIAYKIIAENGLKGWDYVLVGRPDATIERPYQLLEQDLCYGLKRIYKQAFPS